MQINVRVWRGIYRPENLRWNIQYNARAGVEILALFLQRAREDRRQLADWLFKEKFRWVEEGQWDRLGVCLTGKET